MHWILTAVLMTLTAQATTGANPRKASPPATARANAQAKPQAKTDALPLQVALDRAGFSSGVIDGRMGTNTARALDAYRAVQNHDPELLPESLVRYQITADDVAGPFVESIPTDLMAQSKLPALSYRSVAEALAERFHTTPEFLQTVNQGVEFVADTVIMVPNVDPMVPPALRDKTMTQADNTRPVGTSGRGAPPQAASQESPKPSVTVKVSRSSSSLSVTGEDGRVIFFAPVTTGSEHDPLPIGEWKVRGVQYNPPFHYNPELFWDAAEGQSKATIPPGPNGPVGLVWIDLSKPHYGLHGSPEPSKIGKTQSHGCVRLTNWDALRLATLVQPGTPVVFTE
jgi:lipoprotein-anchoring transpeptidase ErfK/SrfK